MYKSFLTIYINIFYSIFVPIAPVAFPRFSDDLYLFATIDEDVIKIVSVPMNWLDLVMGLAQGLLQEGFHI